MIHKKGYYKKPDGTYFAAKTDDYTRAAYESMGFRLTDKKHVPSIVMTPKIETEEEVLKEYMKHFPLVEVQAKELEPVHWSTPQVVTRLITFMRDKDEWQGSSMELQTELKSGDVFQLFTHGATEILEDRGIYVSRKRTKSKRFILVTKD